MRGTETSINPDVLDMLSTITIDNGVVKMPQMDRKLYVATNEVLARLGGKWSKQVGGHLFPDEPTLLIETAVETGRVPAKNPNAFWPTPAPVVKQMIEAADIEAVKSNPCAYEFVEPSAGDGAIVDGLIAYGVPTDCIEAYELQQSKVDALRGRGYWAECIDFLKVGGEPNYHRVLMNPPFCVPGDRMAYLTHIEHAWRHLRDVGVLVAICPASLEFRTDDRTATFREQYVKPYGEITALPEAAFRDSGTDVRTMLLVLRKP